MSRIGTFAKRLTDLMVGLVLLVVTIPLAGLVALLVAVIDGRPVLFKQERPGLDGRVFTMYKFRTMRETDSHEHRWSTDSLRVTPLGKWLRRTSLDELPELTNVVKGDMSLVGPRPLLVEYVPKYTEHHARRHEVRPGVTGLAQVSGRRNLTLGQRLDLDVTYIDSWSYWGDWKILFKTLIEPFRSGADEAQTLEEVDDVGFFSESK